MIDALGLRVGPLDFGEVGWLWGLLLLAPVVYLWWTSRVPGTGFRRWVSLILRCSLVIAILLALAGTRVVWFSKGICVVFVLDQSQSVPGAAREAVRERIGAEVQKMGKEDQFVVVEFGGDAVLGNLPSAKGDMPPPAQVSDSKRTDIARALRLAIASFPTDRQKRIVLFSDGNQNAGDAVREARIAAAQDIDVDVLLLSSARGHEVLVEQVVVPQRVRKDAQFVVRAIVTSDTAQEVEITAQRDGSLIKVPEARRVIKAGTTVIDIPDELGRGGNHEYEVQVRPRIESGDTFPANNTGYAFTTVDAPGRVLLVRGKPESPNYLAPALQASGLTVETTSDTGMPAAVKDFAQFDCVILDDVNGFKMALPRMTGLAEWVKDYGGGLVLIGGDDSFGPGGYKDTPIEEVSPVDMDVKRKKHLASLALVIVNDKSGSMGAPARSGKETKMDLANEGSTQVLKLLDVSDFAMIGAVDTAVKWVGESLWSGAPQVIRMTPKNKQALISNTLTVRAGGGGIYCETALTHSYNLVNAKSVNAMAKHVIMFSDAQDSEEKGKCVELARTNFQKLGVTTSVIGLGTEHDPDVPFLKEVAKAGNGRFYLTDDAMALPRLFAKEAFLVSRQAFVEKKEGIPLTMYSSPLLTGFNSTGVPKVYGYVGTTLKPRATLAIHGEQAEDPVLAHWAVGLGKCVAYTSDSTSRWGRDWAAWPGYTKFWAQVVRWVSRSQNSNGLTTTTVIEGSEGHVVMDAVDDKGRPINNLAGLKAKVIGPYNQSGAPEVELHQVGPGRYTGKFPAKDRGTYLVTVFDGATNQPLSVGGGVLSYPQEYRDLKPNVALLNDMAESTGGKFLQSVEGVFTPKPNFVRSYWSLWQVLLVFLGVGLLMDVAWRRLNMSEWFRRRASEGMPVIVGAGAKGSSVGAFKNVRAARKDVEQQRGSLRERVEELAARPEVVVRPPVASGGSAASATGAPVAKKEEPAGEGGYAGRLMGAKKRAAEQIREQSERKKDS